MSYQVLARKWRPRSFREMVGQTHVLKALINALDSGRLHHAYLFTGTRGVGKTTIARIMARCLNCEQGVSSSPCGECSICREIDEGRFVDLIEVDAASKTKVEDTRELLDNVQYMPSRGRYKVYLIDEVHMLSTSSFNALLKTLEEPPAHVKFLLATTDPQKLPATVLSRCLQFSLKNMPPEFIVEHLSHVLTAEQIAFEEQALWLLGRAADGSMRDAMSLTDQAVAFGQGRVLAEDVRAMLGTLDQGQVFGVLQALLAGDAAALLQGVRQLAELGPDWMSLLGELLGVLHRTSVAQVLPDAVDNGQGDREQILQLAQSLTPEETQFYYQVALHGRRDLPLAPDARDGFEMVMLRMLAFRPVSLPGAPRARLNAGTVAGDSQPVQQQADSEPEPAPVVAAPVTAATAVVTAAAVVAPVVIEPEAEPEPELAPWEEQPGVVASPPVMPEAVAEQPAAGLAETVVAVMPETASPLWAEPGDADSTDDGADEQADEGADESPDTWAGWMPDAAELTALQQDQEQTDLRPEIPPASGLAARWLDLCGQLGLSGMTGNIVRHCSLIEAEGERWLLYLDPQHSALFNAAQQKRINDSLNQILDQPVELEIRVQEPGQETPALAHARRKARQQADAEHSIEQDPVVQGLLSTFAARIVAGSIHPLEPV